LFDGLGSVLALLLVHIRVDDLAVTVVLCHPARAVRAPTISIIVTGIPYSVKMKGSMLMGARPLNTVPSCRVRRASASMVLVSCSHSR
jgi:hypothetical protein